MAVTTVQGVAIRAIAAAVPTTVRTNADIGGDAERPYVEKLSATVGVRERRIVRPGQLGGDLANAAARSAIETLGWAPGSIDLLVVATQTPDRLFPGTSFLVHRKLGLDQGCPVFDINLGCSAFTHGLWTTSSLLAGVGRRALLVNVDTMSRTLGATDHGNQVLFGDAATATALELDRAASPMTFTLASDGRGSESVCLPNSGMSASPEVSPEFFINGPAVLALALRSVPRIVSQLLDESGRTADQVDLFVPHQANAFILEKLAARLPLDASRMVVAMELLGNTSSASIPLTLCAQRARVEASARRLVIMIGFGTGFSLSGVLADLSGTRLVDPLDVP